MHTTNAQPQAHTNYFCQHDGGDMRTKGRHRDRTSSSCLASAGACAVPHHTDPPTYVRACVRACVRARACVRSCVAARCVWQTTMQATACSRRHGQRVVGDMQQMPCERRMDSVQQMPCTSQRGTDDMQQTMDPSGEAQPMAEACVREAVRRDLFVPPGRRRVLRHANTASARAGARLLCACVCVCVCDLRVRRAHRKQIARTQAIYSMSQIGHR